MSILILMKNANDGDKKAKTLVVETLCQTASAFIWLFYIFYYGWITHHSIRDFFIVLGIMLVFSILSDTYTIFIMGEEWVIRRQRVLHNHAQRREEQEHKFKRTGRSY